MLTWAFFDLREQPPDSPAWQQMAEHYGVNAILAQSDWRSPLDQLRSCCNSDGVAAGLYRHNRGDLCAPDSRDRVSDRAAEDRLQHSFDRSKRSPRPTMNAQSAALMLSNW